MKSAVADYKTRVMCLRLEPVTGSPIYITDFPRDLSIGGHTYLSTSGYEFTGYAATAGSSPASSARPRSQTIGIASAACR